MINRNVAPSNDKKRVRLNIISHVLSHVPYQALKVDKPKLPKRQDAGHYKEPDYPYKVIKQVF